MAQLIRLPGQQYDKETGLYYNRHRYYDPQQGRYITQDPIGVRGGWNVYLYPLDPVTVVDPRGLSSLTGTGEAAPNGMMHDPDFWNQPDIAGTNNCYSYAINRPFIRREHPLIFNTPPVLTCKSMAVFMAEDGVIAPNPGGNCPTGYHKIYLALDSDKDFHLYRQDDNGEWSHKRGDAISIKDTDGEKINHPENSNKKFKKFYGLLKDDYSTSCGVFCAKD